MYFWYRRMVSEMYQCHVSSYPVWVMGNKMFLFFTRRTHHLEVCGKQVNEALQRCAQSFAHVGCVAESSMV